MAPVFPFGWNQHARCQIHHGRT